MNPATYDDGEPPFSALKLSDVLWRPRYAKAWWASAAVFWSAMASMPGAARAMDGGFVFALSLFLHPFALIWYLGGRYFWAWRKRLASSSAPRGIAGGSRVAKVDDINGEEFGLLGTGIMSYLDDPTDVVAPLNPAKPLNPLHPMNRY